MAQPLIIRKRPRLIEPSLVVGWTDSGHVGINTVDYLISSLKAEECAEIEPQNFFPLPYALIKGGVLQGIEYQKNSFYYWKNMKSTGDLLLFGSRPPAMNQHEMIDLILDLAEAFHVSRIYTVGGMQANTAHTAEPRIFGIINNPGLRSHLAKYEIESGTDYNGPVSINGLLLGLAKQRGIDAISLWVRVPSYISEIPNPRISMTILEVLTAMLDISIDLNEIESEARHADKQIEKLVSYLRQQNPDIDRHIRRLERNIIPEATKEDKLEFFKDIEEYLREQKGNRDIDPPDK